MTAMPVLRLRRQPAKGHDAPGVAGGGFQDLFAEISGGAAGFDAECDHGFFKQLSRAGAGERRQDNLLPRVPQQAPEVAKLRPALGGDDKPAALRPQHALEEAVEA